MPPELAALAALVAFQIVFGLTVTWIVGNRTGRAYILGSRSEEVDLSSGFVGRMHRARLNTFEALAYMTPTVAILAMAGAGTAFTAIAAWVFVACRVLYCISYALDLVPWRTLFWLIGIAMIAAMLGAAFI